LDKPYSIRRREQTGVRALSTALKTLAVLDVFIGKPKGVRLPEVAEAMRLSRPTAYQRLLTLVEGGWLEQDEQGRYRLSMHVARLAAAALEQADLGSRVQPMLQELAHEVKEAVSLAMLDRGLPIIVSRVESESLLRAEQKLGTILSLEGSASGRVLTAFADDITRRRLKETGERLPSREVLQAARRDGYTLSSGLVQTEVRAIAAPVFNVYGKCSAALSVVAPQTRFKLEAVRGPVIKAAAKITKFQQGLR
jgi:IclR family transcriptional regulator, KDG regulon repressor